MPDILNNGLGPIQFSVEGSFMEKPKLLMDGQEVPYETLNVSYYPAETIEYKDFEGKEVKEEYPELIALSFSLKGKIGQLEANINYRVKANEEGKFVVEQVEAAKPDFFKKKDDKKKDSPKNKKDDKKGKDKDGKKGKPDFKKFKKGKSNDADPNSIMYRKNLYQGIVENIVEDD